MADPTFDGLRADLLAAQAQVQRSKLALRQLAQIVVDVLPDGRVHITSTCAERFDSSYASMPDGRVPAEVRKLLMELRARLAGVSPK